MTKKSKHLIVVILATFAVALISSLIITFAVPLDKNWGGKDNTCTYSKVSALITCCWTEGKMTYCQDWEPFPDGEFNCSPKDTPFLEQPPTPPPSGPAAPLQDGGILQQPPSQGTAPPLTRDQGALPQDGILQREPKDEGTKATPWTIDPSPEDDATQPSTEPLPPCPEDLDEETGLCMLE